MAKDYLGDLTGDVNFLILCNTIALMFGRYTEYDLQFNSTNWKIHFTLSAGTDSITQLKGITTEWTKFLYY